MFETRSRALAGFLMMSTALGSAFALPALAQPAEQTALRSFNIPAQPLGDALTDFGQQSGLQVSVDAAGIRDRSSPGVSGSLSSGEALSKLLTGTGFTYRISGNVVTLERLSQSSETIQLGPVKVDSEADRWKAQVGTPPPVYAGGIVARGQRMGMMGDTDFMDTPVSSVAFTSEFRDNIQAVSVSDVLRYAVSAQTPQAGSTPTTDVIYVRGFNIGTYDGTFDGLPGLLGRMPPVETVERVELLLGPNAFANGQPGSVGGNINIVPKRALDEPLYRVGVNYGTKSIFGGSLDLGQRFGDNGEFGIRGNLAYNEGDTEMKDGLRRTFTRALAFDYRSDTFRVTFDYMGNDRRLPAEAWFVVAPGVDVPDADRASRDFRQPWTWYKDRWDTVVTRAEWEFFPNWTVSGAYGYMWTQVERSSQVYEVIDNAGNTLDAWGGTRGRSNHRRTGDAYEIMLNGKFDTGPIAHNLRVGYGAWGESGLYAGDYPSGDPSGLYPSNVYTPTAYPEFFIPQPVLGPQDDSRTSNKSIFISNEMTALDGRVRLVVGARQASYESESFDGTSWVPAENKKKWSPAVGLLVKPLEWLSVYGNRLESLDAGYEVDRTPPAANQGQILPPLPADQWEFGVKADLGDIAVTAAYFVIDRPSYMYDPVTNLEGPNGRQVNRGFEFSLFGEVIEGLRVYSSLAFIDPRMKETYEGTYDGKLAYSAARFVGNAFADWDIPGVEGLAVIGSISHSGGVYNDEANTQRLPGWTRFDTGLRYRTQFAEMPTTFRFNIDNLADNKYWVSERGTFYMAPGRTFRLSATLDL